MYGLNGQNNRLNILELHRKMNQRNEKKSVCYEKVLEICNKRILNQTERDKTNCLFEFPEYVAGYPLFDLNSCIKYCEKQLVANGFLVKYYFPNKFYISWDFEEIKKDKEEQRKKTPLVAVLPTTKNNANNANNANANSVKQLAIAPNQTSSTQQGSLSLQHLQQQILPSHQQQYQPPQALQPPQVSQPLQSLQQSQASQQSQQSQQSQPSHASIGLPQQTIVPSALHAKMTAPLPTSLPKYDPFDLYSPSIHTPSPNSKGFAEQSDGKKASAIDNSFFANSFKQTLTSGIGSSKMFDYKPSGKLTLNI